MAAVSDYSDGYIAGARENVEAATLYYNQVLITAWSSYAADKGAEAAANRQTALGVRANVASRQEFNAAQDVYDKASRTFQDRRYEEAAIGFEDSISRFETAVVVTRQKRTAAEEALERANQMLADSDERARSAEIILEGGEE